MPRRLAHRRGRKAPNPHPHGPFPVLPLENAAVRKILGPERSYLGEMRSVMRSLVGSRGTKHLPGSADDARRMPEWAKQTGRMKLAEKYAIGLQTAARDRRETRKELQKDRRKTAKTRREAQNEPVFRRDK
jgi:hypothetical protein